MSGGDLVARAREAFRAAASAPPSVTLRGANAIDSYDVAEPFDPSLDPPTDAYVERHAFWGLIYLDARSLQHYAPLLIDYALRTPRDPAMVVEALVRTLRPPDRYPARLAAFTTEQESIVREFLELLALGGVVDGVQEDARLALDEWWGPHPRSRPSADELAALRAEPVVYREAGAPGYTLQVPTTLAGSGLREVPQEFRRVQTWGGYLCGDAHTVIAVNVKPVAYRSLDETVHELRRLFLDADANGVEIDVPGARRGRQLTGSARGDSPVEPRHVVAIVAEAAGEIFSVTIRSWPRNDVRREVDRIASSFRVTDSSPTASGERSV